MGAYDFIRSPIDTTRLRTILHNASASATPSANSKSPAASCAIPDLSAPWSASSKKMQEIFRLIELVAPSTVSVLITGESGTGKELVARTLHDLSPRRNQSPSSPSIAPPFPKP